MIRKTVHIALVILMIALNGAFLKRSIEFSKLYPFDRLLVGNTLVFGLGGSDASFPRGARIVEINGDVATPSNAVDLLVAHRGGGKIEAVVKSGDVVSQGVFPGNQVNVKILGLLLFLLLCADIQFIWGAVVNIIHPSRYLAQLFVYFTFGSCLFNMACIDLFTFKSCIPLFFLSGGALGYICIVVGYNLTNRSISARVTAAVIGIATVFAAAGLFFPAAADSLPLYKLFGLFLVACAFFSIITLTLATLNNKNLYIVRRNITLIVCMVFGFFAPFAVFVAWLYADIGVPPHGIPLLMLIVPLCIGNRLLEYNFFNVKAYMGTHALMLLLLNAGITLAAALTLYYIDRVASLPAEMLLMYVVFALVMIYLLNIKSIAGLKIRNGLFRERGYYANSLQNIAELVSSPAELVIKLESIFAEIKRLTGISSAKLVLFENRPETPDTALAEYIQYLSRDSEPCNFFTKNRNIILRYTLIRNRLDEHSLFLFMRERNIVIIVPLFKGKEVMGAIMLGEKAGDDFFTDEEINYLQTVSMQIYQLVENDRLFNEYITRRSFEKELDIASFIQMRLFPKKAPERKGLHIVFYTRPYIKVTGDYFDFITVDKDRTALVIGDVSGHGLSASMILSMTSSIVTAMLREKKGIERAVQEINHFLNFRYNGVDLITLFIGVFDRRTRELEYINAGHCAPILLRKGKREMEALEGRSKILGADPAANYFSSRCTLNRNDEMVLYTDGLVEIYNESTGEQFSEKNVQDILDRGFEGSIDDKIKMITDQIGRFGNEVVRDDITVIGIKIL